MPPCMRVCVCVLSLKIYARRPFCAAKGNATHVYMYVHERSRRRLTKLKILPFAGRLSFHPPNHQPHPLRLFKKCPPIGVHTHTHTHMQSEPGQPNLLMRAQRECEREGRQPGVDVCVHCFGTSICTHTLKRMEAWL